MKALHQTIRNISYLLVILFISNGISCVNKCGDNEIIFCPLPETGERYFSGYKENSYWIYCNLDSTKKDSVYIVDYSKHRKLEHPGDCHEWDEQVMKIVSTYLSEDTLPCSYQNPKCEESFFHFFNRSITVYLLSKNESDSIYGLENRPNRTLTHIETFSSPLTNQVYNDVVKYETDDFHQKLWFAPKVGLLQYTSFDTGDTLYLTKFYQDEK